VFIKDKAIVSPRVMSIRGAYITSDYLYFDLPDARYDGKNYNVNDFVTEAINNFASKEGQKIHFESKVNNLLLDLFNKKN
jgi:hypothetical protein